MAADRKCTADARSREHSIGRVARARGRTRQLRVRRAAEQSGRHAQARNSRRKNARSARILHTGRFGVPEIARFTRIFRGANTDECTNARIPRTSGCGVRGDAFAARATTFRRSRRRCSALTSWPAAAARGAFVWSPAMFAARPLDRAPRPSPSPVPVTPRPAAPSTPSRSTAASADPAPPPPRPRATTHRPPH